MSRDALRPRTQRPREREQDSEMALGSDLMTNALEGYAFLKIAGKGEGLDALRRMLSAQFNRGPARSPGPPPVWLASCYRKARRWRGLFRRYWCGRLWNEAVCLLSATSGHRPASELS